MRALIAGFAVAAVACGRTEVEPPADPPAPPVKHLPFDLAVGVAAFNDPENAGFEVAPIARWTLSDLTVTSTGRFSATVTTDYEPPPEPQRVGVRDAIFVRLFGTMALGLWGDTYEDRWSGIIGTRSQRSEDHGATFVVSGTFVPPGDPSPDLLVGDFGLAWVRQWSTPLGPRYQVLPASGERYGPIAKTKFDATATFGGRFDFYPPRVLRGELSPVDYTMLFPEP